MGVLEKLRIGPEMDDEFPPDSDENSYGEPDEETDENHDPQPGEAAPRPAPRAKAKPSQIREAGPRVTKKMREDAQAEIESITQVIALAWGWQAPPCGDALHEAAPEFAERLTKVVARNPRWLQRVRDGGLIADIIGVFGALAPVAKVAYAHYTSPKGDSTDGGVIFDPEQFKPYDGTGFSRAG